MWIELPDNLEDHLKTITSATDSSAMAINALIDSMLKSKHIVYVTRQLLEVIIDWEFINPSNKDFLRWIRQKYVYVYSCKDIIKCKIIITTEQSIISVNENIYYVPLDYFYDFRETKLLTEHESDGTLFLNIFKYVSTQENFSNTFSTHFENDSFHGSNVKCKIVQIGDADGMALCIVDSDKDSSKGEFGDTYKAAVKEYNKIKDDHVIFLYALGVREKENLFSPNFYSLICDSCRKVLEVLCEFIDDKEIIKYFDVKDGVKYSKYKETDWFKCYEKVVQRLCQEGLFKLPGEGEEAQKYSCLHGIGDKACSNLCVLLFGKESERNKLFKKLELSEIQKDKFNKLAKNIKDHLPSYIWDIWKNLHEIIFSWGCCISKSYISRFRF